MMEPTHLRNRDDRSRSWPLDRSGLRTVFLQSQVRSASMIVVDEVLKVSVQTALVEYDHVIQALASNGADHPFDVGRCQCDRGAESTCRMPMAFTWSTKSAPKIRSRPRSRYRGAASPG